MIEQPSVIYEPKFDHPESPRLASRVALISGQPMRSELWSTLQLEIIERVKDPLEVDSVLEELRFLKDQAYLPGASDDDTPPEAELVQYAFAEWARRDPVAALEREEQFLDLPTVYWYPLKGILSAWSETDPMNALDGMLERLKVESFHTGAVPMVEPVFRRCVKVDPESLMDRTREAHPYLVESAVDAACQWMNHDGEAVGNWLRAHPEHPVAMSPKFKKAWSKTVNKMKLSD